MTYMSIDELLVYVKCDLDRRFVYKLQRYENGYWMSTLYKKVKAIESHDLDVDEVLIFKNDKEIGFTLIKRVVITKIKGG